MTCIASGEGPYWGDAPEDCDSTWNDAVLSTWNDGVAVVAQVHVVIMGPQEPCVELKVRADGRVLLVLTLEDDRMVACHDHSHHHQAYMMTPRIQRLLDNVDFGGGLYRS
jgi:hypothetical protein